MRHNCLHLSLSNILILYSVILLSLWSEFVRVMCGPWLNTSVRFKLWYFFSWPYLLSRTITLRQGKHWFSWDTTCMAQAAPTVLTYSTPILGTIPTTTSCHTTSPQIMLLLLLLMSSKPVASNNTSQCFGVVCQGLLPHFSIDQPITN